VIGPIPEAIIRRILQTPLDVNSSELQELYGLNRSVIQSIRSGRNYKSIAPEIPRHSAAALKSARLERNGVPEATVRAILVHGPDVLSVDIAADVGLTPATVTAIRIGRRRASIAPEVPRIALNVLRQAMRDNRGTPEPIVRAILSAPLDMSCTELARRHKIVNHSTVTDIRTGRTRRSICPDLPRTPAGVLLRTCADCVLFEASPRRFDDDSGVDTRRPGYCSIGIPECLESPTFARSCSAFQLQTRIASNHGQHLIQRQGD
jgi:hypothetical protein